MHLMVSADSKEQLENKKLMLRNYLDAMGMRAIPIRFEQERILKSMLPIFENQEIKFPPFIEVIKEVTGNKEYSNSNLATKIR